MLRCVMQFFPAPCSSPLTGLCYLYSQATANRMLVNDIPVFHCEFLPVLKFKWRFLAVLLGVPLAVVIMYALCYINKRRKKEVTFFTDPEEVTCTLLEPHVVNQPVILTADATCAGQGTLTAVCSGRKTGSVPVTTSSKSSIYTVSFTPQEQDSYTLAVYFNDKPVSSSPFNVAVLRKQDKEFDASKCVILDLPLGCYLPVVNSDIHFSVDASRAGIAELIVTANGPSGEVFTQFVVIKEAQEKGIFEIKYTPSVPGEHTLHLKYGEDLIPCSPLRFIVVDEFQVPAAIPSACYVLSEDLPLSSNPCKFRISTAGAGHGILTVATRGPGKAVTKIHDNEDGIHSCELMMSVNGTYSIDIMWNGEQIQDSPYQFCFKQIPTRTCSPEKIVCSVTKSSIVSQPVILTADATEAGPGKLTASCFGKESGSVPVCIDRSMSKSDIYSITFTPKQQDDYFISVYFNGQPVPKSPFNVTVLRPDPSFPTRPENKYDASKCVITDLPTGCYLPIVNSDINFSVDATQAGLAELVIITDNQSGDRSRPIISESILKKGYFHIKYIPKVPGEHKLYLTYGGDTIPNSPLLFIVASAKTTSQLNMKPPASECYVVPDDLPLTGTSCKFHISTNGAGGHGALDITTSGPGKAEVKIFDEGKGIYSCELATTVPGTYSVDITWDGQQIQGSPYQLVTGEFAAGLITGFDLESKHFQIGKRYRFKVQCQNLTQEEIFKVEAKPPSAAKVTVFSAGNSTYHVEITPEEEGHHEIWVQYGDNHVAGSPFNVTFFHSTKSCVIKSGVEKNENERDIAFFIVSTKEDKQGNLTATVRNCSDSHSPQVNIENLDEAFTHRVSFPITRNTEYMLSIKCDDEHIEKSPFKLCFDPVANPKACRAFGKGLKISLAGKMALFTINSSGAGSGEPMVTITDQSNVVIESTLLKSGRNRYECSYTPTKPGTHYIAIKWAALPIPCSPFSMICYAPSLYPSPFSITEQPQSSVAGEDIIFTITSSKDVKEQDNFVVFAESSMGVVDGRVTCGVFGAHCCTLKPVLAGIYTVRTCWNGVDIKGSPFQMKVGLPPRPDLVKAYGPGLKGGFVGQEGNFTLETGEAGSGTLDVKVHGPKGAFKIKMRHHPDNNRTILIRYDPKYAGEYNIDITWAGKHIPKSPFKIKIQNQI